MLKDYAMTYICKRAAQQAAYRCILPSKSRRSDERQRGMQETLIF